MASDQMITEQVAPSGLLTGIGFDVMTSADMEKLSNISIIETSDVVNAKLGLPNASLQCATCGTRNIGDCDGHLGIIKLPRTIYHPYFVTDVVKILNQICPGCKSIKHDVKMKGSYLETSTNSGEDLYILEALPKKLTAMERKLLNIWESKMQCPTKSFVACAAKLRVCYFRKCSKVKKKRARTDTQSSCKYCSRSANYWYPALRFKISSKDLEGNKRQTIIAEINEKLPKKFQNKSLSEVLPRDYWNFMRLNPQHEGLDKLRIEVSPEQAFYLLKQIDPEFVKQFVSRRELLFLSSFPVTPNCHRVMEHAYSEGPNLSFDERTKAYKRVVDLSRKIDEFQHHLQSGASAASYVTSRILDCLNVSKLRPSSSPNRGSASSVSGLKWLKEVVLSKRTDNAFRMTMVGDPKIRLGELGIPIDISTNLFVCEPVNCYNLQKLNISCNLHLLAKGELYIRSNGQLTSVCKCNRLKIGDIVYRPLENGDIVLVNRPPSVHQHSLIALAVKILPIQSVVSINPLCCAPLLGDFDGDCLHGYVPQSIGCRVEVGELVSLENQLLNAQDGRSLLSLTHDSLTAAHLLTGNEVFLNKYEMQQLEMLCRFQLPIPSVVKAPTPQTPLWTGMQLFSMLLPRNMDFDIDSRKIQISRGELLSSSGASFWLQNTTAGIFTRMFKCYGRKALDFLFSAQEVLCEYLTMRGLSVSLGDFYLTSDSYSRRKMLAEVCCGLEEAEDACHIKQLMLDPKLEFLLKSNDESADQSHCINHYNIATDISQISIAAFKDVFHDLQNVIHHYVSKDNSMMAMIHAGSKGSMLKLVQQSVCLGLQLSPSIFPFKIPQKLSCVSWNNQKALECGMHEDAPQHVGAQRSYAVIESSFLDGLNPLECLVHAISGRANLFSENAELPGTLTRKLMFCMRDLYVAYDGTVRHAYGQQVVQFDYKIPESSIHCNSHEMFGDEDDDSSGLGGQPVGSWAACAISEAAYGALDHPINSIEASPLLNLKNVLECPKARSSVSQTASLFLSMGLGRWRYGFEYGALEVKNYLDRVLFSDLVTTILIFYSGSEVHGTNLSPWIMHFHLSKEMMMRKRLKVQSIIDQLARNYNSMNEEFDSELPRLYFVSKDCAANDMQKEHGERFCITVTAESAGLLTQLDTIRDLVIPFLLKTLVKGFWEFKMLEILCDTRPSSCGELFLKVTMSEACLPGKFWSTLQSACVPIMNLIDWDRSHPDRTYDMYSAYGIDTAWKYFLGSLKSATSNIGRSIHQEHLLMIADCLSMTGEFHGLSTKGLKRQRDNASISSPFTQACFSNPGNCFINAAKQGSVDHLYGTLDAVAWGKEVPIGTGGPFEIIYTGKVHGQRETESIYRTLDNLKVEKSQRENNKVGIPDHHSIPAKWKGRSVNSKAGAGFRVSNEQSSFDEGQGIDGFLNDNHVHKGGGQSKGLSEFDDSCIEPHTALDFGSTYVSRKVGSWEDVVDMCNSLREILHKYPMNGYLNETDKSSVVKALIHHPKSKVKIGTGIQEIKIGRSHLHQKSRCFILIRTDGTAEDVSYRKCVYGAAEQISPKFRSMVGKMLRSGGVV